MTLLPNARRPLRGFLVVHVCACMAAATPRVAAQQVVLRGFVADDRSGLPIAAARASLVEAGVETRTGEDGAFTLADAPIGRCFVRVQASGYPAVVEKVELLPGDEVFLPVFVTSAAAVLDELLVIGTRTRPVAKEGAQTAADLLARQVPGISVFTPGGRSTPTGLGLRGRGTFGAGEPVIVLDGVLFSGGVGQAMDRLRQISAGDVKAIRLLRGPSAAFLYGAPHGVVYVQTHEGPSSP